MIELSIRKPVTVAVGVIIVVLFGWLSLLRVPVQLTPDITKPQITGVQIRLSRSVFRRNIHRRDDLRVSRRSRRPCPRRKLPNIAFCA